MGSIDGKIALVTGGASGLGKAIALRLAAEGARVVITDLQRTLGEAVATQAGLTFLTQDVCDESRWNEIVSHVEKQFGALQILVNNAGIVGSVQRADPESASLESWRQVFAVNVEGVFLGCRTAIPALRRSRGGSIINMSSIAAIHAVPEAMAYGASKAAVRYITRAVALHCARSGSGIRCNSVHPGNVRTPLLERAMADLAQSRNVSLEEVIAEFKRESPQGSFQEPADVAEAVLFLASDLSKHITGIQLVVDGGNTLQQE
jgi:3(or 17)beta-hydroxysteroid dehydrogenase